MYKIECVIQSVKLGNKVLELSCVPLPKYSYGDHYFGVNEAEKDPEKFFKGITIDTLNSKLKDSGNSAALVSLYATGKPLTIEFD